MRTAAPPLIVEQPRSAPAIAALLERRLRAEGFGPDPLLDALIAIGARYGEILVEHLNAAPSAMRATFAAALPGEVGLPIPAEVFVSFKPVMTAASQAPDVVVPAYTTVAAPPEGDDPEPVLFETLADLKLVRAEARRAFVVDARRMRHADVGDVLSARGRSNEPLDAASPIEQTLFIAVPEAFGRAPLSRLSVEVDVISGGVRPPLALIAWGIQTTNGFVALAVRSDSTLQLTQSGSVELAVPEAWPPMSLAGIDALWLGCRMLPGDAPLAEGARFAAPRVSGIRVRAAAHAPAHPPDVVASGGIALDASKDYFPFGERPRFGDVFHLSAPGFALPGARVTLEVRLSNPFGSDGPLPAVRREGKPGVVWELHTRRGWVALDATDGTQSLTQDGNVVFSVPADPVEQSVAGITAAWVRARLASGNYGAPKAVDGMLHPAAPSIAALTVQTDVELGPSAAQGLVRSGPFELQLLEPPVPPVLDVFGPLGETEAALYLGFDVPLLQRAALHGRRLNLLVEPLPPPGRAVYRAAPPGGDFPASSRPAQAGDWPGGFEGFRETRGAPVSAAARWQLLTGDGWQDCEAVDGSGGFARAGVLEVTLAGLPVSWPGLRGDDAARLVWLRRVSAPVESLPRLRRVALNSVRARQTIRFENEVLGSSTGRPGQRFQALHAPVIDEVVLEVRESEFAPATWSRWQCVPDFAASDGQSRHFTLDRGTGAIGFGNGRYGRIPPAGPNNVRLGAYHAGGGARGNRAAGAIVQLHSAIPYVESVVNPVPAAGGQDGANAFDASAASVWLRHRDRAVGADDYADLARAASREVARAWCRGSAARGVTPSASGGQPDAPGSVSVVIVPVSQAPRPQPAPDLLARVEAYLRPRRPLSVELVLMGPEYVAVSVDVQVGCRPGYSPHATAALCRERVTAFLHPVTGNRHGDGWAPGQRPHRSDLIAALGAVEGVDHVVALRLQVDDAGLGDPGAALVAAGDIKVLA